MVVLVSTNFMYKEYFEDRVMTESHSPAKQACQYT